MRKGKRLKETTTDNKTKSQPRPFSELECSNEHHGSGNKENKSPHDKISIFISIFALLIAIIAAYYGCRQVKVAENTAERQLRAYITTLIRDSNQSFENQPIGVDFLIINYGQTPAKDVRFCGAINILPYPLPPEYTFNYPTRDFQSRGTCFPGDKANMVALVRANIFTPNEINEIISINSNRRIYVFGRILYTDIFNKKRSTSFCYILIPETSGKKAVWQTAEGYNDFE